MMSRMKEIAHRRTLRSVFCLIRDPRKWLFLQIYERFLGTQEIPQHFA